MKKIAVIGAGQAAISAIVSLRQAGFQGAIRLIGEEPFPPYQRPPLSKTYMKGQVDAERLFFKPAPWYTDNAIDLALDTRATGIDTGARRVATDPGGHIDYDALLIATGSRARKLTLPGADLANVFELRTLTDVARIRSSLAQGANLVVIGAGYIGLEAAAAATQIGVNVTVVEYAERVLERVTSPILSEFFVRKHRAEGVEIQTSARIEKLVGAKGRVSGVELRDGTVLPADAVLVGIGIVPNQELASDAGIQCNNGIVVDRDARTSDRFVFAAGDCTHRPLVHYAREGRLESVHNAIEQGKLAAAAMLGKPRPLEDCPWFWSDQYDVKLQIAGLSAGYDDIVIRGDVNSGHFAAFYLKESRLIATDAINSPQEFLLSKKLITAHSIFDPAALADTTRSIKEIAASCSAGLE